ncbi:MAG TPA: carboxylesterase family protein [Clostridiales bacterium]|nr:carboxylesterase family protein [Clostridiales bacterium]
MGLILKVSNGQIRGVETENAFVYKGIPYAKPPVGKLRFNAPQACEPWEGIYEADTFPNRCVQGSQSPDSMYGKEFYADSEWIPPESEDCLYLNVWIPKFVKEPCPVAIWIHGGGFLSGFSSEVEFDGEEYAKRGVILVTINYRLGMLGFFCHPELTARDGRSGNYGLLDQIAAIDWVRENIGAFGGDINNITLFGQSAGGISVLSLVSSPLMEGKIHRAIIQSAGGYKGLIKQMIALNRHEKVFAGFLKKKRLSLDSLYDIPAEQLLSLADKFLRYAPLRTGLFLNFVPVIDGYVIPMNVSLAAEQGKTMRIPYMLGCTKNDITVGKSGVKDKAKNNMLTSASDWCRIHAAQGINGYVYYFTHDLPGDGNGAFHSSELWYMFGTLDRCWRPMGKTDYVLSERMIDHWVAFMKNDDPGWQAYSKENPYIEEF